MTKLSPKVGDYTHWGRIQAIYHLAPGIISASTASHGGIWLSPDRESQIPATVRAIARQYAPAQWYEEDCDCCIVAVWFAPEMKPDFVRDALAYVTADARMRPLVDALNERDAERARELARRERLYAQDDADADARDADYHGTFGTES